jgi:hypothetical protein
VPINRHQIWWLPTLVEALNRDPTVTSGLWRTLMNSTRKKLMKG